MGLPVGVVGPLDYDHIERPCGYLEAARKQWQICRQRTA